MFQNLKREDTKKRRQCGDVTRLLSFLKRGKLATNMSTTGT